MTPCKYNLPAKRSRKKWVFLPLIGAIVGFTLLHHRQERHAAMVMLREPAQKTFSSDPTSDGAEFSHAIDAFLATEYPTRAAAIRALSRRLPDAVREVAGQPTAIDLPPTADADLKQAICNTISRTFSGVSVGDSADAATDGATRAVQIAIYKDATTSDRLGLLELVVSSRQQTRRLSTRYGDHPWADDLGHYIGEHPDQTWLVGRSAKPAMTLGEAQKLAEQDASAKLNELLLQSIEQRAARFDRRLAQRSLGRMRLALPVHDRFVQQFPREYGDIWSEAVLLEVPQGYVDSASDEYLTAVQRYDHRVKRTGVSVGIVLVTIVAAYLLLNTMTLSYFSGRLRAAAIFSALIALAIAAAVIVA